MSQLFEDARNKISSSLIRSMFDSAGSEIKAGEYYILSPLRPDKHVGSFHINLESGAWYDHRDEEGGDFIELVSQVNSCSLVEAAKMIISESGGVYVEESDYVKPADNKGYDPVIIPDTFDNKQSIQDTVKRQFFIDLWGDPVKIWRYFNHEKEWLFCVVKFEKEIVVDGKKKIDKTTPAFYMAENGKWYSKGARKKLTPAEPFRIETIDNKKDKILIVEGEKCADVEVPGYKVISWLGGSSAVRQTKWHLLSKCHHIVIWPDADSGRNKAEELKPEHEQAGMKAAIYIKSILPQAKILNVYEHIDIEIANGFDIADYVGAGEDKKDPLRFITDYYPDKSIDIPMDPLEYKNYFVKDFYGETGLRQFAGGFWRYDTARHFWKKIIKNDILCNLQTWLIDTSLQYRIKAKTEPTSFINKMKNYIERHAVGYIDKNPFLDAAIQPYLHFKNGVVKIKPRGMDWKSRHDTDEEHFKDLYPLNCLDFELDFDNYKKIDPERDCPLFFKFCREVIPDKYISEMTDKQKEVEYSSSIDFFCQIMAYALSPTKGNEYFFALWGKEGTGKSFFIDILKSIIGEDFCVIRPSRDTENNRFASSGLWGKKVYIEPDMKTRKNLSEEFIKAFAGEQTITIEEKNEPSKDGVKISLAMFFLSNYEFKTSGQEGLKRRIILVPFMNNIPESKKDRLMIRKMKGEYKHNNGSKFDERPAIVALILQAFERYQKNNFSFSVPGWSEAAKEKWSIESNTVSSFLHETYFNENVTETIHRATLYDKYKDWCEIEDRKHYGKNNFYEEVRLHSPKIEEIKVTGSNMFKIIDNDPQDTIPF